jgi:hypothetical protein
MIHSLDNLFEVRVEPSKYENTERELEAVAAGTKAMSVFSFPSSAIDNHPLYLKLCAIALELNLSMAITDRNETDQDPRLRTADVVLTKPAELWRAAAYSAFKNVFELYDWSDAAEHFESSLLGYSDEDTANWLRARSVSEISWSGRTFYLLLTPAQAIGVRALSKRCIDPTLITEPIQVFINRNRHPMRENADNIVPAGYVVARAAVRHSFFRKLFGRQILPGESDVITSLLTTENAVEMNSALASNFEFQEAGTWR